MFTYEFTIVNEDNCKKIVYETSNSYIEAVKNLHKNYGRDWCVYNYKIVHSNY